MPACLPFLDMASALLIVLTGVIALVAFGGAYYLVFPIFLQVYQNPTADCQSSANCTSIFGTLHDAMFIILEMCLGGIFLSMYMRSVRRDQTESYSSYSGGFEGF